MTFKDDFARFAGLNTLPGLPAATEGVKDEAYREGLSAGDAVVQALGKGWAKTPKENTKKAWAPIVAKYAGEQEFMNDSQWAKGFGSALTGHFGKDMKLEGAPVLTARARTSKTEAEEDVANIILKQMGGFGRLKMMIGAKNFSKTDNSVTFQWPSKQRSTGNALKVTLKGDDTYDMEFFNGPKSVKKYDGVYNDQLKSIFEKQTGLYLTMSATSPEDDELTEESEIGRAQLPAYAAQNVKNIEKIIVGSDFETAWKGINGVILQIKVNGTVRFTAKMLRDISGLPDFRWVEANDEYVTVGC